MAPEAPESIATLDLFALGRRAAAARDERLGPRGSFVRARQLLANGSWRGPRDAAESYLDDADLAAIGGLSAAAAAGVDLLVAGAFSAEVQAAAEAGIRVLLRLPYRVGESDGERTSRLTVVGGIGWNVWGVMPAPAGEPYGLDTLRFYALCRLALPKVPHLLADVGALGPRLAQMRDKVRAGEELSFDDGVALYAHPNLMELGALANEVRERLHGDRTYFNRNLHINATNVCEASCRFCSFARLKEGDPAAYTMSHEEAWGRLRARVAAENPITEIHIVNGLHPGLGFDYYTELLAGLKRIQPGIHLKAFTAVEIFYFAKKFGMSIEAVLQALRAAGLDSLPGGGAEIFAGRVRKKICDDKCTGDEWLQVHRVAHQAGLRSNCTMLYGHIETA